MKTFTLDSQGALAGYDYLSRLSMDRWAWEYLRRNEDFRSDASVRDTGDVSERMAPCAPIRMLKARRSQTLAERWGLVLMPDPNKNGFEADVVWNRAAFPDQVEIHCSPRSPDQACAIWEQSLRSCRMTHITDSQGREFLLTRRKGRVVQVRCSGMSLVGTEPVRMKLTISDITAYERRLKVQKAALEIYNDEPDPSRPLWTKTTQILRNGLIALDGIACGMNRREIAETLYGREKVASGWNADRGSIRDTIRYILRKAESLRRGGYLMELLGARIGPGRILA